MDQNFDILLTYLIATLAIFVLIYLFIRSAPSQNGKSPNDLITSSACRTKLLALGFKPTEEWILRDAFIEGWQYRFEASYKGEKVWCYLDAKSGELQRVAKQFFTEPIST